MPSIVVRRLAPALAAAALLVSCAGLHSPFGKSRPAAEDVPAQIAAAREDFAAGRTAAALERLRKALLATGVNSDVRLELEREVERVASRRIEELSGSSASSSDPVASAGRGDPGELARMLELGLPAPLAATAGVRAAGLYLERGRPYKAWTTLRKTETKYPLHHESRAASAVLVQAGLKMAAEPDTFLGLFSDHDDGVAALEYLVVTYPSEPRCDEAYAELAQVYEDDGQWELAIERWNELIKWQRGSPLAVEAAARVPRARMAQIESPEYDRMQIERALAEFDFWLERHAGHALEPGVRADRAECMLRLAASDYQIARFYRRIDRPYGARWHARRALEQAQAAGDLELAQRSKDLLETVEENATPAAVTSP
jgi:outer membrane protein assembly factor BamD (BamD/ComL family)